MSDRLLRQLADLREIMMPMLLCQARQDHQFQRFLRSLGL